MIWPFFYPQDCPPPNAESACGTYYRCVSNDPPREQDFRSYREIWPDRNYHGSECEACGISLFAEIIDIVNLQNRVGFFRRQSVAMGNLSEECGKIIASPSMYGASHHCWWPPEGFQTWKLFYVLKTTTE